MGLTPRQQKFGKGLARTVDYCMDVKNKRVMKK